MRAAVLRLPNKLNDIQVMHLKPSQAVITAGRVNDLEDRLKYLEECCQALPELHALQEQQKQAQRQLDHLGRKLQELIEGKAKEVNIYI